MRTITKNTIDNFKLHLFEDEKSSNTMNKYIHDVNAFVTWLNGRELSKSSVLEYKQSICSAYSVASVNSMISSLNSLFTHLGWNDLKVKTIKVQKQIFINKSRELSKSEYIRLVDSAKKKNNERLYYIIQTIASTGIRISELSAVTVDAINSGKFQVNCKGKRRLVLLPNQLCKKLKKYVKKKNIKSGSVFVTKSGKPIDRWSIWKLLKNLAKSANVSAQKVFPHNLRHLFAHTFYSAQKDIVRLADILGHSNINTTRIYTLGSGDVHIKQIQSLGLLRC